MQHNFNPGPLTRDAAAALNALSRRAYRPTRGSVPIIVNEDSNAVIVRLGGDSDGGSGINKSGILAKITQQHSSSNFKYDWEEVTLSSSGLVVALDGGRSGSLALETHAFELDDQEVAVDTIVLIHQLANGIRWFDVDELSDGRPGTITVEEVDGSPSYTSVATLRFDSADGFVVTNPSSGVARVDMADATSVQRGIVSLTSQLMGAGRKTFTANGTDASVAGVSAANVQIPISVISLGTSAPYAALPDYLDVQSLSGFVIGSGADDRNAFAFFSETSDSGWSYHSWVFTLNGSAVSGNSNPGYFWYRTATVGIGDDDDVHGTGGLIITGVYQVWTGTVVKRGTTGTVSGLEIVSGLVISGTVSVSFASVTSTPTTLAGYGITDAQPLDATLTALAAYNTNGLLTQTAADTFTGRTLTGTADVITVSNGDGVSGNPTVTIAATYVGQTSITTLGTIATGTWSATAIALGKGGTGAALADPGADRIMFWDDSGGAVTWLTVGSGLTITDTTITATGTTLADGDYGDVTVSSSGTVITIDNDVVTYAKMQNVSATDKLLGRSTAGAGDVEEIACTAAGRAILDDADAAAQRTTLGLAIGTNVQAYDAELAALAGLTSAADKLPYFTGSGTASLADFTAAGRAILDDADAAAQRTTLGVGTGDSPQFTAINLGHASDTTLARSGAGDMTIEGNAVYRAGGTDVPLADGGTGASLADPGADRILFWDDSGGATTWLTAGTGLTITDTTITASSDLGVIVLQDQKTSGTNGGTFTSGADRTRDLNTEVIDSGSNCTLASNQFTLTAGTYDILAFVPAGGVDQHVATLYNATDATFVSGIYSTSGWAYSGSGNVVTSHAIIMGRFTVAASKALEIKHRCITTRATDGFGVAHNLTTEVYTTVYLRRIS